MFSLEWCEPLKIENEKGMFCWKTFFYRGSTNQLKTKTTVLPYHTNIKQSLR